MSCPHACDDGAVSDATWWRPDQGGIVVYVRVTPGAARDEIVGVRDDRLAIRVRARAVEGKANASVIDVLARALGMRPRALAIRRGERSREKSIFVRGPSSPTLR
jgi:uncharacterized protein (TIGR00251 family)